MLTYNKKYGFIKLFSILLVTILFISTSVVFFIYYQAINALIHIKTERPIELSLNPDEFIFEEVIFPSKKDNVLLNGTFFSATTPSNKTLIIVHGFNENRLMSGRTEMLVRYLTPRGYNVFAFDLRGQGESEGNFISFGYYEKYDVCGAIDYLKQRGKVGEKIALLGFSMGAVTAIEATGIDERVNVLIADSSFKDLELYIMNNINTLLNDEHMISDNFGDLSYCSIVHYLPFNKEVVTGIANLYGVHINEVSPIGTLKQITNKPIFLIHGKKDTVIPCSNSELIFDSIKNNSNTQFWLSEKADHIESILMYSEEYLKRVETFLNENI